jgi:hypothetical protein
MEKTWIQDSGSGMEKFGSGILGKHPGSAKLEISSPNLLGLKEPNNNQTLCGKAFWDKIKSFLPCKAFKRTGFFNLLYNKTWPPSPNYIPRGETITAAYLHKALAKIRSGFWA